MPVDPYSQMAFVEILNILLTAGHIVDVNRFLINRNANPLSGSSSCSIASLISKKLEHSHSRLMSRSGISSHRRSKGTVGNLRGVRRHHVRHREPAGQGTGQRRQDTHQLGKPAVESNSVTMLCRFLNATSPLTTNTGRSGKHSRRRLS